MAERRVRKTESLLKSRAAIDAQLLTRDGLEVELFRSLHAKCNLQLSEKLGLEHAGMNPTSGLDEYAPIKVIKCLDHGVNSEKFTDMDGFGRGENYIKI